MTLPALDEAALDRIDERFAASGVRLLVGSTVDLVGVTRAKTVPAARARAFHLAGMGASPTWSVFCVDNHIAFTSRLGVVGDLRLRADLAALRVLGDGLAWAPADLCEQDGSPSTLCPRALLRRGQEALAAHGLSARIGAELEMVLTQPDGSPLPAGSWVSYGLGPVLDRERFLADLVAAADAVSLPLEQVHAEFGPGQYELSLAPADPLTAADAVVLAKLVIGRLARRHGLGVSFSPQPFADGVGNGAHLHMSLRHNEVPLFSGGPGPYGLTADGTSAVAGIVSGLPELLGVFAGSLLSGHRLRPGRWAGAFACWGLENREAAVRFCAATAGNPHGAHVELKCVDPSANPYLAVAALLGLALDGVTRSLELPAEVTDDPARRGDLVALPADQGAVLDAMADSALARRLLGPDILDAVLTVRRYERDTYGDEDLATRADRFRLTWSV
ncbi:type I glutamate--ammonia ligase [Streptoalloteichus hindustanus]|uniref:glutamine synthetase family protein n=1 Tax=Streptoalloteichus hindustanus TaxID=2017 RepID=UPI000936044F|nr:glutamine synthetase family protein [Streptoalloteichus hindustanus]